MPIRLTLITKLNLSSGNGSPSRLTVRPAAPKPAEFTQARRGPSAAAAATATITTTTIDTGLQVEDPTTTNLKIGNVASTEMMIDMVIGDLREEIKNLDQHLPKATPETTTDPQKIDKTGHSTSIAQN